MMPWTVVLIAAVVERVRLIWSEGKEHSASPEDSWPLFLLIWMLVPILFFSASQSKLPGYILPAVPAGALLVAEYLAARRGRKENRSFRSCSPPRTEFFAELLVFAALSAASHC